MLSQVGPRTPREHFDAFRSAINWSENFILGLIAFQAVMFLVCYSVSRRDRPLAPWVCVVVFIGLVVRLAERLNAYGAQHWKDFATQDYFDARGIFLGIMLSGPLLLDCLMMLLMFLGEASSLLVQGVKRGEMKSNKTKKKDANEPTPYSSRATSKKGQTKTNKQE
jgi:transmembrane protein 18